MDTNIANRLLDTHAALNDSIYLMFLVHAAVFEHEARDEAGEGLPEDLGGMGAALSRCKARVAETTLLVKSCREAVSGIGLKVPMHSMDQWLAAATAYLKFMQELSISDVNALVDRQTQLVDKLCPKWSSCVSDDALNLEMAEVRLVQSSAMPLLRPALDKLWRAINGISMFGQELGLPPISEYMGTREWISLAQNSLAFGKQTIKVTSAVRVITMKKYDQLPIVMKHADSFPKALRDKLISLQESRLEDGKPASAAPTKGASTSTATGVASSSGIAAMKRKASSGDLGRASSKGEERAKRSAGRR